MTKVAENDDIDLDDVAMEEVEKQPDAEKKEEGKDPEDAVDRLKAQIKAESDRRKAAEERATKAEEAGARAVKSSQEQQLDAYEESYTNAAALRKREIESLEDDIAAALDEGDHKKSAQLQTKLYKAVNELERAEGGKAKVAEIREQLKKAPVKEESSGEAYTDAAKSWINEHPRFNTDADYKAEAIAAHHAAVGRGIKVDSPEYFAMLNKRLEREFPEDDEDLGSQDREEEEEKRPAKKQSQSMAAPSRGAGGAGKPGKAKFKLSPDEVEAAEVCGMTPEEYYADKYGNK